MKFSQRYKNAGPLIWFTAALMLFLTVGVSLSISRQRSLLVQHEYADMEREAALLEALISDDLVRRNYDDVGHDLQAFVNRYPEVCAIKVVDSNGTVLAGYVQQGTPKKVLTSPHSSRALSTTIELTHDLAHLQHGLTALTWQNIAASIVFAGMMSAFLWVVLRKTAFIPLEKAMSELGRVNVSLEQKVSERTMDLMHANTDLQNEIAEREAAERALLTKERAIATSINGIAFTDFDLRITYVNTSCLAMWGFSRPDEVVGRSGNDFWESTESVKMIMQHLQSSGFWFGELVARKKDGTLFDVQLSADIVKDGQGRPICIMASFLDISDRKNADAELRKERDFTNAILNTVGAIVLVLDREGRIISFNRTCEQVSEYTFEEARGKYFWEFLLSSEQVEPVRAVFEMLSEGKFPSSYENYWVNKSGIKRMISWSNTCLTDHAGRVSHVIATGIDITDKRSAAEQLEKSLALQRMVVENISEMIYLVSLSKEGLRQEMHFVGGRVADIIGYSAEDFLKDSLFWFGLVHPEDLPGLTASTRNLVRFRTEVTRLYRLRHKHTQEYLWLEDKIMPQFDDLGMVVGYFGVARDITRRKMAEDKLRKALIRAEEEKNKSEAIIAAIGDGISIQDRDFKVLYQNTHLKELTGNHIGEYCYRAYRGRTEICEDCAIARSFADGNIHVIEHTLMTEKGPRFVEITASPLKDASGHIVAGLELVRNVTDRKKAEESLRLAYETQFVINALLRIPLEEKPLKEVLQEALQIILSSSWCLSHPKGAICLTGAGAFPAMTVQRGFDDSDGGECAQPDPEASLCGHAAVSGIIQFSRDPGRSGCGCSAADRHYRIPIGPAGKCLGVLSLCLRNRQSDAPDDDHEFFIAAAGALRGLIERKHLEEEREQMISDLQSLLNKVSASRHEWQETFDSITDMISILDEENRIIKANKAFATRLGLTPRDVINKKCHELFQGQDAAVECPDLKMLDQSSPLTVETTDPQSGRMFLVSLFPFYSAESKTRGTVRIARDITTAKENEMRLIMSERLAALGQMASGVAHEINNPLAAIAGCVDGMNRRISRGEFDRELFNKYLTIMKEELTRSKKITTTMLSVVQKKDYEKKEMNIHDALNKTLEIIGYQGRLKDVEIQKDLEEKIPAVLGSEGELKQVFLIILGNALDAMHDKGVLAIKTIVAGNALSVQISDSGPGIPPDNFSRIFDPFFTTKSDRGGTGLGLSIANRIITAHHGRIRVASGGAPGTGAVFTVELPLSLSY